MIASSGRMDGKAHTFPIRVYYEDTDAGGIVYHASYLRFAERARTEMLRCIGFAHQQLIERHRAMMVVRRLEIDYVRPARLDDHLEVRTKLSALGGASVRMLQDVLPAGAGADEAHVRIVVRLACVNGDGRPERLPDDFVAVAAQLIDR